MKKHQIALTTLLLVSGCAFTSSKTSSSTSNNTSSNLTSYSIKEDLTSFLITPGDPIENLTSNDLFNLENKIEIKIDISPKQLKLLDEDYHNYKKSQIYRIVDNLEIKLIIKGYEYVFNYQNVGIRQKGNMSREEVLTSDNLLKNMIHYKISFDCLFDDPNIYKEDVISYSEEEKLLIKSQNFLGLDKIDLKWNRNLDQTHVKEIYALDVYRSCNLISQRATLCHLKLNDQTNDYNLGIYTLYESFDKDIIKNNLKNGVYNMPTWAEERSGSYGVNGAKYGDLYKVTYGYGKGSGTPNMTYYNNDMIGVSPDDGLNCPVYDRKTNKDVSYDDAILKTALDVLNSGSNYSKINEYFDLNYFAINEACSYMLGSPDDLRFNYNNYALYASRVDKRIRIISMDLDRCLGISYDYDPFNNASSKIDVYSKRTCQGNQVNKLFTKTILSSSSNEYKTLYTNFLIELANSSWFSNEKFETYYQKAKNNYDDPLIYKVTNLGGLRENLGVGFSLNETYRGRDGNMSFSEYIKNKKEMVSKISPIVNENNNENNSSSNSSSSSPKTSTTSSSSKESSSVSKNSYAEDNINLNLEIRLSKSFLEANKNKFNETGDVDFDNFYISGNKEPLSWSDGIKFENLDDHLSVNLKINDIKGNTTLKFKFKYGEKWFRFLDDENIYINNQNNTSLITDFSNSGNMEYIVDPAISELLIEFK